MRNIPKSLIFNWDQTAIQLQLVPTGVNEAKAKKVVIANSKVLHMLEFFMKLLSH